MTKKPNKRNPHAKDGRTISGRNARQGQIILNTPGRRAIFLIGLAGAAVLAIVTQIYLLS
jgi:hypothetical protein